MFSFPSPIFVRGSRFCVWPLIFALGCHAFLPAAVAAPSLPNKSTPLPASKLSALHRQIGDSFWRAENTLQSQIEAPGDAALLFIPLAADDPLRAEYSRAAAAADAFIQLADANKTQSWMRPAVLYLGGLAKFSLGDNAGALQLLERLQAEFPDYKRDQYINDRDQPNPQYSVPARPGVSKLVFYLRLQVALKNAPDAFASLRQITQDALNTLAAQREYSRLLAARSDKYNTLIFEESRFGSEPDQRRAGALPSTLVLVETAWDALLEKSLQKGAKPVRDFLRGLSTPDAPLSKQAIYRLANIDQLIIKQYFAQAQRQLNEKNFDGARASYRQIMAEYSGTDAARQAEAELPKIVPVAVAFYKVEADKNYNPGDKINVAQPQIKARDYYRKMYLEDPTGPQADYAYFYWTEAIATEPGHVPEAVRQLQDWLNKFPDSPLRAQALFTMGHFVGGAPIAKYSEGIKWFKKVLDEYPNDKYYVSESLWISAFLYGWLNDFKSGLPLLEKLQKEHPESFRWRHTQGWIDRYKEKIASGGQWP